MVKDAGADVTHIDMRDFEMPLYDGDDEAQNAIPANAIKLKNIFVEHDGFFIASPEYNSSIAPLVNNTLDWLTRPHEENEPPLVAFNGKFAALGAVPPGGLGGAAHDVGEYRRHRGADTSRDQFWHESIW